MLSLNSSFISADAIGPVPTQGEQVHLLLDAPVTPTTYTFELTSHCNERCPGCGNNELFSRHHPYLSGEQWIELLEKVRSHARYIRLTGGECTLHPDFQAIVSHVDSFDIPFAIFTNGAWQKPDEVIAFFSRLKNLSALLISLHGPDAETHNTFTGTRFFERTIENIRRTSAAGITVDTNTVFMRANWQKIESIIKLSRTLGARCAVFSRYYGSALPFVDLSDLELAEAAQTVDRLRAEGYPTKVNPCIPECFIASSSGGCGAGVTLCTIDPMGNVRPCNHAPLFMGNLREMEMPEIWSSSEALQWRSLIPESCTSCSALSRCRGGCRATALHRNLPADPLMRTPIAKVPPQPRKIYAGLRPVRQFDIRAENNGALLVRFNRVVSVTSQGAVVAQAMDGNRTLADLSANFGQEALQLAVELYEQGLVEFTE